MTPLEHLITLLLCTFAAWNIISLTAFFTSDREGRVTVTGYLTILGPPLLLLILGAPIMTVLGYLLAGTAILLSLPYLIAIPLAIARQGVSATIRDLRTLPYDTAAGQPPSRGQHRDGPQPPQKAVRIDRELVYNRWEVILDADDISMSRGRINRLKDRLNDAERDQLKQFWQWQDDTRRGQDTSSTPPLTQQTGTGQRPTLPDGTPVVFKDQLQDR